MSQRRDLTRDEADFFRYLKHPTRRHLAEVVDRFGAKLWNVALRLAGNEPDASDQGGLRTDKDGRFAVLVDDGVYAIQVRPDVEPQPPPVPGVRPGDPPPSFKSAANEPAILNLPGKASQVFKSPSALQIFSIDFDFIWP